MEQTSPEMNQRVPISRILKGILEQAPKDDFKLSWLIFTLQERSFGIVMMLLGLLAMVPVGSTVPGLMLAALASQMILGWTEPALPQFIAARRLPTRYLQRVGERAIPFLAQVENAIYPRWPTVFQAAKRAIGPVILLLTLVLLLIPVPLSNVIPGVLIASISLAYIEEDGVLLVVTLFAGVALIGIASAAVWGAVIGAISISRNW